VVDEVAASGDNWLDSVRDLAGNKVSTEYVPAQNHIVSHEYRVILRS